MISSALAIIFVAYILQCVFSWLQLKRIYGKVDEVRRLHKRRSLSSGNRFRATEISGNEER